MRRCMHPTIAQLAERETVEAKQLSLGHWFESGWSEIFFIGLLEVFLIFIYLNIKTEIFDRMDVH